MTNMNKEQLSSALQLYFVMGSPNCVQRPVDVLSEAIKGGITLFQFREKGHGALAGDQKYALAEELQYICRKNEIPFIVDDDVDLAIALKADGVHVGQEDEPIESVREKIGNKIVGVSVHNLEEAKKAMQADYFGVGPIFPTKTKEDAKPVQGVSVIRQLRLAGIQTPIVGIGGITEKNASEVIRAGAEGVSVITAISQAGNVREAAAAIRKEISACSKR